MEAGEFREEGGIADVDLQNSPIDAGHSRLFGEFRTGDCLPDILKLGVSPFSGIPSQRDQFTDRLRDMDRFGSRLHIRSLEATISGPC